MSLLRNNILNAGVEVIHRNLSEKQFLIFASILVGVTTGIAAVVLKTLVHYIRKFILEDYIEHTRILYLFLPAIGIAMVVFLVKPFLKHGVSGGSVNILHAIAKKGSFLPFEQMYSYIITSGLTIAFGGSAGLESPMVNTGAAIGSNFSRVNRLSYKERTLLLAAGAAGAISSAFNAPIAGTLFALEVILVDISITAFIPLLIASVSGGLVSSIILKEDILLNFQSLTPFDYHNVPFYIILAVLGGLMSLYYVNFFRWLERFFERISSKLFRWIIGSILLVALLAFFPSLFGEGYESIKLLEANRAAEIFKNSPFRFSGLSDWSLFLLLTLVMFVKVIATGATIGGGGVGGNFAPSLFLGAYLGFAFSLLFKLVGVELPLSNFILVAMGGILSGVFHAPLTGIFLIAEISGGYSLIIPLMIVSSISYLMVTFFHPESMDIKKLMQSGTIISADKDTSILGRIEIGSLIETDFAVLRPHETLGSVIEQIKQSKRNVFPVVDEKNSLVALVQLNNIREEIFNPALYNTITVKEIMEKPEAKVLLNESIFSVMKKFDETGHWNLPVVNEGIYLGFLSKSSILSRYRSELISYYN